MKEHNFTGLKQLNKVLTDIKTRTINRKFIVFIVIIILTIILFSGYNILIGSDNTIDNNEKIAEEKKVEILNSTVTTQWSSGCKCDDTYEFHIKPGFYHTVYIGYGAYYNIEGELLNIGGREIYKVVINVKFYDKNGTELFNAIQLNSSVIIFNLSEGEYEKFTMKVRPEEYYYLHKDEELEDVYDIFYTVESFDFDISIVEEKS